MFITERSARRLRSFLDGYQLARIEMGHVDEVVPSLPGFTAWLNARYFGGSLGGNSWQELVLELAAGDDELAFERFHREIGVYELEGHAIQ